MLIDGGPDYRTFWAVFSIAFVHQKGHKNCYTIKVYTLCFPNMLWNQNLTMFSDLAGPFIQTIPPTSLPIVPKSWTAIDIRLVYQGEPPVNIACVNFSSPLKIVRWISRNAVDVTELQPTVKYLGILLIYGSQNQQRLLPGTTKQHGKISDEVHINLQLCLLLV